MKRVFLLSALLALYQIAFACEICGCGNSNFQIGILPSFSKGFMGIRYTYSQYQSQMQNDPTQFSHDYYHSTELWGGFQLKKWQIMAFVPYIQSRKVSDDATVNSSGLGDVSLLANHLLRSTTWLSKNERTTFRNELWAGGGVKIPTGNVNVDQLNPDFNIGDFNSQPGTGSIDYLMNLTHNLTFNNSGIVSNFTYRINTSNAQGFKYGNRLYASSIYFHTFGNSVLKIRPNAGASLQSNTANYFNSNIVEGSNGYILSAAVGVNLVHKKWGIMLQGFAPILQDTNRGQTNLQGKAVVGLTYSF
jgi:hypothetical protein